ncbi:Prefoldin subunit-domain-containing protein, partial [Lipomyces japonicus]|uniref:Prefoldin subunit-domain-containing protein n=1 Tax=Lipomyces japonicus TaxID=56871 RepID=UPI0034CE2DCE
LYKHTSKIMSQPGSSNATTSSTITAKKQADLQAQYNNYKSTLQQLAQKIGELESETDEHKLVLESLRPLPEDRKCFRMIGGVLVERTVKEVIPALETNAKGVEQVMDQLVKEYKKTEDELKAWQTKNKVQVVQQNQ